MQSAEFLVGLVQDLLGGGGYFGVCVGIRFMLSRHLRLHSGIWAYIKFRFYIGSRVHTGLRIYAKP